MLRKSGTAHRPVLVNPVSPARHFAERSVQLNAERPPDFVANDEAGSTQQAARSQVRSLIVPRKFLKQRVGLRLGRRETQVVVMRPWVTNPRGASLGLHSARGFIPVRTLCVVLMPVDDARFVGPFSEAWHRLAMRAAGHVGLHGVLILPHGHRPERAVLVFQKRRGDRSLDAPYLRDAALGVMHKHWHKPEGASSKPCDADLWHLFLRCVN